MHKNRFLLFAVFLNVAVTVISLRESGELPQLTIPYLDKIFHFVAYFMLSILWCSYIFLLKSSYKIHKILTLVIIFLTAYGIIIEVLQAEFTTTRYFEFSDIIANLLGVFVGLTIFNGYIKFKLNNN